MIEYNVYFTSSAIEETVIKPSWFNFSTFKTVICGTFLVPLGNTSFVCMKCLLFNGTINTMPSHITTHANNTRVISNLVVNDF